MQVLDLESYFMNKGCVGFDSEGLSGGLLLSWSKNLSVSILACSRNVIFCNVNDLISEYMMMFVYVAPCVDDRPYVWDHLCSLLNSFPGPIYILGDFNQIKFPS